MTKTCPIFCLALVVAIVTSSVQGAFAQSLDISAELLYSYDVNTDIKATSAQIVGDAAGRTLWVGRVAEEGKACTLLYSDTQGAQLYRYRYNDRDTVCLDGALSADGDVFVRAQTLLQEDMPPEEIPPSGLTARLSRDGQEVWAVSDAQALELEDRRLGPFLGEYVQPVPPLVYLPRIDRVLGFAFGLITVGNPLLVAQGLVFSGDAGALRRRGLQFDTSGIAVGTIGGTALRGDGYVLLYRYRPMNVGTDFFIYDGRDAVEFVEPARQSWEGRVVRAAVYGPEGRLYVVWDSLAEPRDDEPEGGGDSPDGASEPPSQLTIVDSNLRLLSSKEWTPLMVDDRVVVRPQKLIFGAKYGMALYRQGDSAWIRFFDAEDGESLGVVALHERIDQSPRAILPSADGDARLVAYEAGLGQAFEYRLRVTMAEPGEDMGDAGQADMTSDDAGSLPIIAPRSEVQADAVQQGCGCRTFSRRSTPFPPAWWALVGLSVLTYCYFRRSLTQD